MMRAKRFSFLALALVGTAFFVSAQGEARSNRPVVVSRSPYRPMVAPRLLARQPHTRFRATSVRPTSQAPLQMGVELGTLGRRNGVKGGVGLELLPGGRVFVQGPLAGNWYIRPSLGFFTRSQAVGSVESGERVFELGCNLHYRFSEPNQVSFFSLGLNSRFDLALNRFAVENGGSSTTVLRYRLGPGLVWAAEIAEGTAVHVNAEGTLPTTKPLRVLFGATLGLSFRLN